MKQFDKYIPSVFVVCSPFQALCAVAAIRQLEIEDYKMIAFLPRGDVRNFQVESVFYYFNINYTTISPSNFLETNYYKYRPFFRRTNKFKRLFLGDFRTVFLYCIGCGVVSDNADVVYLDDGNITISQLRGRDTEPLSKSAVGLFEIYSKRRGFKFYKNLLTIYSDIPNSNYNIEGLQLNIINDGNRDFSKPVKNVYIVGTNLARYCGPLDLPEDNFVHELDVLMGELLAEYPDDKVIYIPHGCETKKYAEQLCEKYGVAFLKPSTTIEVELLSAINYPKAIYGYTSTALLTLKKMFPKSKVVNIVFEFNNKENPFVIDILDCSRYYANNGVDWINVR